MVKSDTETLIQELKWDPKMQEIAKHILIEYIHRGSENNQRVVPFSGCTLSGKRLVLTDHNGIDFWLPYHRILKIFNPETNLVLYEKSGQQIDEEFNDPELE